MLRNLLICYLRINNWRKICALYYGECIFFFVKDSAHWKLISVKIINFQMVFILIFHTSNDCSTNLFGSHNWTRTSDPLINSQMLYRLSYVGIIRCVFGNLNNVKFMFNFRKIISHQISLM